MNGPLSIIEKNPNQTFAISLFPIYLLQALTTVGWVTMMWTDNRLTWDKTKFDNIDRLRVDSSEVIIYYNSICFCSIM